MDTLTHGLSGSLVGRALSGRIKKVRPKTFILVGFQAACFPDFDFLFTLISFESYFVNHRGITHSFFLMPIFALVIAWLFALMLKHKVFFTKNWVDEDATVKEITKDLYLLTVCGIAIHILGDIVTQFGTMFLSPFSDRRFELGSVFIIDLWFTGIIVAGLLASWIFKKHKPLIATAFLLLLAGYVGYTQVMKHEAEKVAVAYLKSKTIATDDVVIYSSPRQVSASNWTISAFDKKKEVYYTADFSLNENKKINTDFRNQNFIQLMNNSFPAYKDAVWITLPLWGRNQEEQEFAKRTWNDPRFKIYRWFYQIPVFDSLIKNDHQTCGYFRDMRFGGVGRENGTPFVFGICEKKDGTSFRAQLTNGMVKNLDWKK